MQFGRKRRADDGAHVAEAAGAEMFAGPLPDRFGNVLVHGTAATIEVLELPRARIAGSHEKKHAPARSSRALQKGFDGIAPEVGIHRDRINIPNGVKPA